MAKVEIPFTDESLDTDDPVSSGISLALLAVGFAAFGIAAVGGNRIRNIVMNAVGFEGDGEPTLQLGA